MGLTKAENSPGLSFDIDNPRQQYSPGDVISGRVNLNTAEDSAIGQITVNLWGRAKSRIIQQHGQAVTYHRGRTKLFDLEKVLYEGQYTHKPGSFSWPFEFVVPDLADPAAILDGEKWKPKDHFSGTTEEDNLDLVLPPSNYHSRLMFGRQAECFVEYVLSTTLTEPEGTHKIRKPQTKTSTLPVIFHPLSTPEPIQDWGLTEDHRIFTISTLKLLPEHAGTSLGFRDRARSIFQRDTIPKYTFNLQVQAPSVIQLLHPTPIPFLITLTPDLSPGNTTIDTSLGLPEVILRSASIQLKAHIRCRAAGTFSDNKTYEVPILAKRPVNHLLVPSSNASSENDKVFDLGALFDLRIGNANLGSKLETPLCPSFNTYNVAREYQLIWELEFECAEKVEKFSSQKTGPLCKVIMSAGTTQTTFTPGGGDQELLGADLSQATTSNSSGFWTRRRVSGEEVSTTSSSRGEKEKPGFTPASTALAAGNHPFTTTTTSPTAGEKAKNEISLPAYADHSNPTLAPTSNPNPISSSKTKEQEAAEDRARARLADQPTISFSNPHQHPFTNTLSASSPAAGQQGIGGHPQIITGTPATVESVPDDGNQLPKYVP